MSLHYPVKYQYRKTSDNLKQPLLSTTNHKVV